MENELEVMTAESGTVALLNRSEIDMQIATAHKYPRSIVKFRQEVQQMVTLNEQVASECIYALPRDGKTIEGPSARFAEVVASAWGNARAGARVVNDQGEFVTAQGVFHDLQRNVAITYEVQRRIVNRNGNRFSADMIGVTANAACSIALRNAILKGIPKAFWADMYEAARKTAMGDVKTLANRRADALAAFLKYGVAQEQVFAKLQVAGVEDISLEHLLLLRGLLTAIKDGDTTPEQAFAVEGSPASKPAVSMPKAKTPAAPQPAAAAGIPDPAPSAEQAPASAADQADPDTGELFQVPPGAHEVKPATSSNGALATDGERQLILKRARNAGVEVAALMESAGITGLPADLSGLTKDGFIALKDALPK